MRLGEMCGSAHRDSTVITVVAPLPGEAFDTLIVQTQSFLIARADFLTLARDAYCPGALSPRGIVGGV
jgi:hypothetical protein